MKILTILLSAAVVFLFSAQSNADDDDSRKKRIHRADHFQHVHHINHRTDRRWPNKRIKKYKRYRSKHYHYPRHKRKHYGHSGYGKRYNHYYGKELIGGYILGSVVYHLLSDYERSTYSNRYWEDRYNQCFKVKYRHGREVYVEVPRRYCY